MNLSFRNRIAAYYLFTTAFIVTIIFITIYLIVYKTVYAHLKGDLDAEISEVYNSILILDNNEYIFTNPLEWNEGEHKQIEVNPTFIQVNNANGKIIKKSMNLLDDSLIVKVGEKEQFYFNTNLSHAAVYQIQYPVLDEDDRIISYILVAVPLEDSKIVLANLKNSLFISFTIILVLLFFATRYIAGKSIAPINDVILTANKITRENLKERISLPVNQDELHELISTINELLNRLEDNLLREKQFTSDASHELRTPLSVIKGTLEVLVRKPRDINQYEEKINYCINETDRITKLIDQLLLLARYDSGKVLPNKVDTDINNILENVITRLQPNILEKEININLSSKGNTFALADPSMMEIIFDNIISNSIKYSDNKSNIDITLNDISFSIKCVIKDNGIGMTEEQIKRVFDRFYRSDESRNTEAGGYGLGLSIVKKLCDLQEIVLKVESTPSKGTSFILHINKQY